jgi:hypothetical protein
MSFAFTLPPLTLPSDIIAKQLSIDLPAGVDAGFFNSIRSLASGAGLFTNPFTSHIAGLQTVVSQLNTLQGAASAVGAGSVLSGITSAVTEPIQIFTNIGTNIVPMPLTMSSSLASAVSAAGASLPGISAGDAPVIGPFLTSLGVPSIGTIMNVSMSQFSLNQMCGTIDPANPLPLLANFSSMLTNMTNGASALLGSAQSMVTNLLSLPSPDLAGGLNSALTSIQGTIGSSIGGPIASFGGQTFLAIKDQMATGLANSMRHMVETNYALKFMTTGLDSTTGGGFGGILGPGVTSAIQSFPSNINVGHIIP